MLNEHHCSTPAETSRAGGPSALPQAQPLPHQNQLRCPAQSGRAGRCQPLQALQQDSSHMHSSPLYAASESEDSEFESSAGNHAKQHQAQASQDHKSNPARPMRTARAHTSSFSNAAVDAHKPEAKKDDAVMPQPARQTRASSGQASRAVKPPTGRAQSRAKHTAPAKQADKQKGRKHGPGGKDDQEGFGLLSEDEQLPVRPSKGDVSKPDCTVQVRWGISPRVTSCSQHAQRAALREQDVSTTGASILSRACWPCTTLYKLQLQHLLHLLIAPVSRAVCDCGPQTHFRLWSLVQCTLYQGFLSRTGHDPSSSS